MQIGDKVNVPQDGFVDVKVVLIETMPHLQNGTEEKKIWIKTEFGTVYGYTPAAIEPVSEFFIQDDIWPSRKWNADRTDYIDLSGE